MPDFFYRIKINCKKITILTQIFNHFGAFIAEALVTVIAVFTLFDHTNNSFLAGNIKFRYTLSP